MLKQQLLAKNLSTFVFVAAMLSSIYSFAQMANDGWSPRVVGAYRQVASLQNAVATQQGPKPVYQTDDTTGRTTCVWNCQEVGETGQARMHEIKVMGADERLLAASTTFTPEEKTRYSVVSRIECITKRGTVAGSTGFMIRNLTTMVTNAHSFHDPVDGSKIAANKCSAVFYNERGVSVESIPIKMVSSRWDRKGYLGDVSNDVALIQLSAPTKIPLIYPKVRYGESTDQLTPVTMVGFHGDLPRPIDKKIMRKVTGKAVTVPAGAKSYLDAIEDGYPLKNPENLVATDFDSNHGTSGAPVYNAAGEIIGINEGVSQETGGNVFDKKTNYNIFIRFDSQFKADVDAFTSQI